MAKGTRLSFRNRRIDRWVDRQISRGEPELRFVAPLLGATGPLVDVGANSGIYSAVALRSGRRVVAFEPLPAMATRLRDMIGANGVVHEVALSDTECVEDLFVPHDGHQDVTTRASLEDGIDADLDHRRVVVRTATLDSFAIPEAAVLKIDVEGHELAVLRGADETIQRCAPAIIVEVEENRAPGSFDAVAALLRGHGYSGHWIEKGALEPIATFDLAVHQRPSMRPRWGQSCPADYINNFVWLPPESRLLGAGS